jgi:hypothetical protein
MFSSHMCVCCAPTLPLLPLLPLLLMAQACVAPCLASAGVLSASFTPFYSL